MSENYLNRDTNFMNQLQDVYLALGFTEEQATNLVCATPSVCDIPLLRQAFEDLKANKTSPLSVHIGEILCEWADAREIEYNDQII